MNSTGQASERGALKDLNKIIERAKQELEHMMDLTPQIILLVDGRGRILRANKALLKFGGFDGFGQVLGRPLERIFPCEKKSFFEVLLRERGSSGTHVATILCGDGLRRELSFKPIGPGGGSDLHVLMVSDITDEKAQQALLEKKHKIEAASAMVGGLMHNINQPLTVITVSAELMHMSIEKGTYQLDEMKQQLEMIMDLAMQAAGILKQAENPRDFVTERYLGSGSHEIVNIPSP